MLGFGDKGLVISQTVCRLLEELRLAVEVLTGERVSFYEWEMNKRKDAGRGTFLVGNNKVPLKASLPFVGDPRFWFGAEEKEYRTKTLCDCSMWVSAVGPLDKADQPYDGVWYGGLGYSQRHTGPAASYKLYSLAA